MADKKSWRDYSKQAGGSSNNSDKKRKSWRDYSKQAGTTDYFSVESDNADNGSYITNRVNNWLSNHNAYVADYEKRFSGRKYSYDDAYVGDSAVWMNTMTKRKEKSDAEANAILSYLDQNKDYLDTNWVKQVRETITGARESQNKIVDIANQDNQWWNSFGTEELLKQYGSAEKAYTETGKAIAKRNDQLALDTDAYAAELEELKKFIDDAYKVGNGWYEYYQAGKTDYLDYDKSEDPHRLEVYNRLQNEYGGDVSLASDDYIQRVRYLEEAKRVQEQAREDEEYARQLAPYLALMQNADFAENSVFKSKYLHPAEKVYDPTTGHEYVYDTGYEDIWYDYINRQKAAIDLQGNMDTNDYSFLAGLDKGYLKEMSDEEIKIYNYLYKTQSKDAAEEFLSLITSDLAYRRRQRQQEEAALYATEHPFHASAWSVLSSPAKAISAIGQIGDYMDDGKIDENAGYNKYSYINSTIRGTVANNIAKPENGAWGNVGSWTYQLGMSMGDFLMNTAVSGGSPMLSSALMGSGAMADTVIAAKDRGLSDDQAFTLGVIAGGAEIITEKFSLEALLKGDLSKGTLKYILTNAFTEGTEEVSSSLINLMADVIVSKDQSEWEMSIKKYLEEHPGATETDAFTNVLFDTAASLGLDFLGGSLMGGTMGSVGAGINYVTEVAPALGKNREAVEKYGKSVPEMIKAGLSSDPKSRGYDLANFYQSKIDSGKELSGYEIRQLKEAIETDAAIELHGKIEEAHAQFVAETKKEAVEVAKARLTELGETGDIDAIAAAAAKKATGEKLTSKEKKLLVNSNGSQVAKEMTLEEGENTYKSLGDRIGGDGQFGVSELGKAVVRDSGQEVNLSKAEVTKVGNGEITFKLEDGSEVYAGDIDFASDDQSYLVSAVSSIENITPPAATAMLHDIVDTSKPLGKQLNGIDEAFTYGYNGYSEADLKAGSFTGGITKKQMMSAYKFGQAARSANAEAADSPKVRMRTELQAKLTATQRAEKQSKRFESGNVGVYFMDGENITKIGERGGIKGEGENVQRRMAAVNYAKLLSKLGIGKNYYFYESYLSKTLKDEDGNALRVYRDSNGEEVSAPNGYYLNGDIYIDLNAGDEGQGTTLFTLGHELTHFIKEWSLKSFNTLADFLVSEYGKTDMTMHERVLAKQAELNDIRKNRDGDDYKPVKYDEAYEEVVADAMSAMLADGNLHEKLADLRTKDKDLVRKIFEFFKNMIAKFQALYKNLDPEQKDARDVRAMKDSFDRIQQAFAEALVEASDNFYASIESSVNTYAEAVAADAQVKAESETEVEAESEVETSDAVATEELLQEIDELAEEASDIHSQIQTAKEEFDSTSDAEEKQQLLDDISDLADQMDDVGEQVFVSLESLPLSPENRRWVEKVKANYAKVVANQRPMSANAEKALREVASILAANHKTPLPKVGDVVETNAKPIPTDEIITDGAVVTDGNGEKYSIRSMKHDIAEGKMFEDLKKVCGWTDAQVKTLRTQLTDLVEYMIPYRNILDMNESYGMEGRRFSPYKPNSDPLYKISMDFSTLCSKRLLTQYVIEQLQLRENRPMSAEEQMAIRDMLNEYRKVEKGLQVACAMCYVEAARLKSPKQMQRWLDDPAPHLINYFALKNTEFNDSVKKAQADFKESRGYDRNAPKKDMKQADVRELNKIGPRLRAEYQPSAEEQAIIEKAKSLPNSTYLTAGNLASLSETDPVIYAAYTSFVRTATRSKSLETDEPYYYGDSTRDNGNGIIVSDSFIEAVNRENGMRFSSWSDWRIQHMLDYITAVIDNSVRGAAMHGYTKFPDEVRVLGKTGMMFNMSGVAGTQTGLNEDGTLNFSETESIDVNEAIQLRKEFPETAGLQCIGVGNEHIIALLRSDIIDYVIPYHVSGLNAALRRMADIHGWKDYTSTQHAVVDKNIKFEDAADKEHWHEEPVFSEFFVGYDTGMSGIEAMRASAERYKQMCRDRGMKPKFEQFAGEDNYWKLLIDRKMINQQTGNLIRQKAVTPTFDFGTIKGVVDKFVQNYDAGLEARALGHIVENWDSIPQRIKDLKKKGGSKAKKTAKAVDTLANETVAAQPKDAGVKNSDRVSNKKLAVEQYSSQDTDYNDTLDSHQDLTQDIYYPKSGREISIFNRQYINKTNGLKPGKIRYITIYTGSNVYAVRACGTDGLNPYIGKIVGYESLDSYYLNAAREELSYGFDENRKRNDSLSDEIRYNRRRGNVSYRSIKERLTAEGYDYLFEDESSSFGDGDRRESGRDRKNSGVKNSERSASKLDQDYLDALSRGDMETVQRMVDEAAKAEDYAARMFHETDADNIHIFDISRGTHGGKDYETPYGIFTKTTATSIGLGKKQMPLFVKALRTLRVENREDVRNKIPGFAKYYDQIQAIDKKYDALSNQLEDEELDAFYEWIKEHPDVDMDKVYPMEYIIEGKPADIDAPRYLEAHEKYMKNRTEWEEAYNAVAVKAKEFITDYLRSNGYDSMYFVIDAGSRGRQTDSLIVLDENQVKSAAPVTYDDNGNIIPLSERFNTEKKDIRYSERDSAGNKLSKQQQEFFIDSVVRDKDGNLLVMYHGTSKGGYTVFDTYYGNHGLFGIGSYFTDNKEIAQTYTKKGRGTSPQVYEVYLDIRNPLDMDAKADPAEWAEAFPDVDFPENGTNEEFYRAVEQWCEDEMMYKWDAAETIQAGIESGMGYDGITHIGGGRVDPNGVRHRVYIAFQPEQIKRTDNQNPTKNPDIRYSERSGDAVSNRTLLANAFEGLSQNSDEYAMIQRYRNRIRLLEEQEQKLDEVTAEIRDIRFTAGKYDAKKLAELESKKKEISEAITRHDKKLLEMEVSAPFRKVIEQERKKESQKTKAHIAEIQQNKQLRAEQAELRHKVRKVIRDLDKILKRGNKERNVKEDMKGFVSKALELADYLFTDHISNDDLIMRGIDADLMRGDEAELVRETEEIIRQIQDNYGTITEAEYERLTARKKRNMDSLRELLTKQRNRRLNTPVYNLFNDLVTEYAKLKDSDQDAVKAAYNPEVERFLRSYMGDTMDGADSDKKTLLQNMRVADMTTQELEHLYYAYTMVLHSVRDANKLFVQGKAESVQKMADQIFADFSQRKIPEKKMAIVVRNIANKIGWDYEKLYYALDRIGSEAFTELVMNIANSENIVMQDVIEAAIFRDEMVEKYGFNNWNVSKKIDREFLDNTGKKFKLTLGQLMALYAYSRRKGAWDHIEYGGFVFGDEELTNPNPADSYKLTREQCEALTDLLTKEQKGYVEAMQKFLSETMGGKGNEVSMMLYGIKMFTEKNYFPIKVAGQFKPQAQEAQAKAAAGFASMTNAGFTHEQNPNAKAPFVLEGFNEVWADHVNEMSRYHGTVPALEDMRRVMNRSSYSEAGTESMSIKQLMENAFGKEAVDYFDALYREANSGAVRDKLQAKANKLLSLFRKNSVAYSLSVLIQQPASVVRAYAMIDRKYFGRKGFGVITSGVAKAVTSKWNKAYANAYNEMLKYAPGVTMAKEIGGFDTHTGSSIRGYLLDTKKSFGQKVKTDKHGKIIGGIKAAYEFVDDNAIANLPNVADKIAWIEIWNACKRETIAKHKDLVPTSDAFLQIVGDRFTEVIRATQVYDSMFSKSPMLKSKNFYVQMLVSFMNEPNTVANMAEKAVRDMTKGGRMNWMSGLKTAHVVIHSIIFTNLLKSIIYAMRDDDEDETYIEKYIEALSSGLFNDFIPFNYIPLVRDAWSLAQGYDVERADMAIVADAIDAIYGVSKNWFTNTDSMTKEQLEEFDKKVIEANWKLAESLAAFAGIPMKNIRREINGFMDHARIASENAGKTTWPSAWDNVIDGVIDSIPFMSSKPKTDKLYEAMIAGDKAYVERIKGSYNTESAYQSAVRKALRENDSRIQDAAMARYEGRTEDYKRIFREIQAEGIFSFDDIMSAVNSEENKIRNKVEPEKQTSSYSAKDYVEAIVLGDINSATAIKNDIIDTMVANGKTRKEADKEFTSSISSGIRDAYSSGLLDEARAEEMLQDYADKDEDKAASMVSYWSFCEDHPEYKDILSESNVADYYEFAEPANISVEVFAKYVEGTKDLTTIYDEWGDVEASKREQVLEVIDSLPISKKQKDALYLAHRYAESKIWDVPW